MEGEAVDTMTVTQFKARALEVLKRVEEEQAEVVLTKRGRPIAQVVPYREPAGSLEPGGLAHLLVFEGDVVSPLGGELWEAGR